MKKIIRRYIDWLHLRWPAGIVESLPLTNKNGLTNLPGVWISGDLTGIPLLKYAAESGRHVANMAKNYLSDNSKSQKPTSASGTDTGALHDGKWKKENELSYIDRVWDLCIIGGGVSGMACALEAERLGLHFQVFESKKIFYTIHDFPKGKPIYLYPREEEVSSTLQLVGDTKENLLENLESDQNIKNIYQNNTNQSVVSHFQKANHFYELMDENNKLLARTKTICIAIGKSGDYRRLNIPGEDLPKVYNRLHDPAEFNEKKVAVVGGGDSALESAIALSDAGASVSLSYRKGDFARAKSDNIELVNSLIHAGKITFYPETNPVEIRENSIVLESKNSTTQVIKNDYVFTMIGRKAPLDFFRKSGIPISGEWSWKKIGTLLIFVGFCIGLYHWKMDGSWIHSLFRSQGYFPFHWESWRAQFHPSEGIAYIMATNLVSPSFYYSLVYTMLIGIFGIRRVWKRPSTYIKLQTLALFLFQLIPLFLLPFIILPWMGSAGIWDSGMGAWIADEFFPRVDYGLGREYWRAFGLILAWPLFIWNVFSGGPMWGWLVVSFIQTFIIIPLIVWRWGKGAYCGWVCSCGALAETLGDDHRKKMPHGPIWNRLNLLGQGILFLAFFLLILRLGSWFLPGFMAYPLQQLFNGMLSGWFPLSYYYIVDVWLAGILGVGLYFHFSGRTWCRFACPLAALMHIYARFSEFRIFSDKKKCISCNVCTSVCHQGIDVMSFANKGLPMEDPECVRCSACVVNCPTNVLNFGRLDKNGNIFPDIFSARVNESDNIKV